MHVRNETERVRGTASRYMAELEGGSAFCIKSFHMVRVAKDGSADIYYDHAGFDRTSAAP
jgi:hypothetical protein